VLGLFWCVDGLLKLQPYFFHHFASGVIDPNAAGQPVVIADPIIWIGGLVKSHQSMFTVLAALAETSIGVGLLVRRTVKPALLVSFAWAVNIWLTGEGLGGLFTGTAPDPLTGVIGTAPLYIVAGLLVWPREPDADTTGSRFGMLGERGARLAWAALWLGAAALWLVPSNAGGAALKSAVSAAPSGASWLASLQSDAAAAVVHSGITITVLLAVASAAIALSILWVRGARIALLVSVSISLVFWVLAEGMGGLLTGQATDVGTGPLMILIAILLLPLASLRASAISRAPARAPAVTQTEASRA
jgi:hypothetical protein